MTDTRPELEADQAQPASYPGTLQPCVSPTVNESCNSPGNETETQLTHEFESKAVGHTFIVSSQSENQTQNTDIENPKFHPLMLTPPSAQLRGGRCGHNRVEVEGMSEAREHTLPEEDASSPPATNYRSFQSESEKFETVEPDHNPSAVAVHQHSHPKDDDTGSQTSLVTDVKKQTFLPNTQEQQRLENIDERACLEAGAVEKEQEQTFSGQHPMHHTLQVLNAAGAAEMSGKNSTEELPLKTAGEGLFQKRTQRHSEAGYQNETKAQTEGVVHITLQITSREKDIPVPREASGIRVHAECAFSGELSSAQSNQALSRCFSSIAIEPCCSEQALSSPPSSQERSPAEEQTTELADCDRNLQTTAQEAYRETVIKSATEGTEEMREDGVCHEGQEQKPADEETMLSDSALTETMVKPETMDEQIKLETHVNSETVVEENIMCKTDKQPETVEKDNNVHEPDVNSMTSEKEYIFLKTNEEADTTETEDSILDTDKKSDAAAGENFIRQRANEVETNENENVTCENVPVAEITLKIPDSDIALSETITCADKGIEKSERDNTSVQSNTGVSRCFSSIAIHPCCSEQTNTPEKGVETDEKTETNVSDFSSVSNTFLEDEGIGCENMTKKSGKAEKNAISEKTLDTDKLETEGNITSENTLCVDEKSDTLDQENMTPDSVLQMDKSLETAGDGYITESTVKADEGSEEACEPDNKSETVCGDNIATTKAACKASGTMSKEKPAHKKRLEVDKRSETEGDYNILLENTTRADEKSDTSSAQSNKALSQCLKSIAIEPCCSEHATSNENTAPEKAVETDKESVTARSDDITEAIPKAGKTLDTIDKENITFEKALETDNKPETAGNDTVTSENTVKASDEANTLDEKPPSENTSSAQSNKAISQCFSSIAIEPCCSESKIFETDDTLQTAYSDNVQLENIAKPGHESGTSDMENTVFDKTLETDKTLTLLDPEVPVGHGPQGPLGLKESKAADSDDITENTVKTGKELDTSDKEKPIPEKTYKMDNSETPDWFDVPESTETLQLQEIEQKDKSVRYFENSLKSNLHGKEIFTPETERIAEQTDGLQECAVSDSLLDQSHSHLSRSFSSIAIHVCVSEQTISQGTDPTKRKENQGKSLEEELEQQKSIMTSDTLREADKTKKTEKETLLKGPEENQTTKTQGKDMTKEEVSTLDVSSGGDNQNRVVLEEVHGTNHIAETANCVASEKLEEMNQRMHRAGKEGRTETIMKTEGVPPTTNVFGLTSARARADGPSSGLLRAEHVCCIGHEDALTSGGELQRNNSSEKNYEVPIEGVTRVCLTPPSAELSGGGLYGSEWELGQQGLEEAGHLCGFTETGKHEVVHPDEMEQEDLEIGKSDAKITANQAQVTEVFEEGWQREHTDDVIPSLIDLTNGALTPPKHVQENSKQQSERSLTPRLKVTLNPSEDAHENFMEQAASSIVNRAHVSTIQDENAQDKCTEQCHMDHTNIVLTSTEAVHEKYGKQITSQIVPQARVAIDEDEQKLHMEQGSVNGTKVALCHRKIVNEEDDEQFVVGLGDQTNVALASQDDGQNHQEKRMEETATLTLRSPVLYPLSTLPLVLCSPVLDPLSTIADQAQANIVQEDNRQEKQMEHTAADVEDRANVTPAPPADVRDEHVKQAAQQSHNKAHIAVISPENDQEKHVEQIVDWEQVGPARVILTQAEERQRAQPPLEPVDKTDVVPTLAENNQENHTRNMVRRPQEPVDHIEDHQAKHSTRTAIELRRLQRRMQPKPSLVEQKRGHEEEKNEESEACEMEELLTSMEEGRRRSKVLGKQNRLRRIRQAISAIEKSRKGNKRSKVPPKIDHILCFIDNPDKKRLASSCPPEDKDPDPDPQQTKSVEASSKQPDVALLCSHRPPRSCAEGGVSMIGLNNASEEKGEYAQFDRQLSSEDQQCMVTEQGKENVTCKLEHPVPSTSAAGSGDSPNSKPYARKTEMSQMGDLSNCSDEEVADLPKLLGEDVRDLPEYPVEDVKEVYDQSEGMGDLCKHTTEEVASRLKLPSKDIGDLPTRLTEEWLYHPKDIAQTSTTESQTSLSKCFSSIQTNSFGSDELNCGHSVHSDWSDSEHFLYNEDSDTSSVDLDEFLQDTVHTERPSSPASRTYISAFSSHIQHQMKIASRRRSRRNWSTRSLENVVHDVMPYCEKINRQRVLLQGDLVMFDDHSRDSTKSYLQQMAERQALRNTHTSAPVAATVSSPDTAVGLSPLATSFPSTNVKPWVSSTNATTLSANQTRWKPATSVLRSPRQNKSVAPVYGQIDSCAFGTPRRNKSAARVYTQKTSSEFGLPTPDDSTAPMYGQIPFEMPEALGIRQNRQERNWRLTRKRIRKHDAPTIEEGDSFELKVLHGGATKILKKTKHEKRISCILC